MSSKLKSISRRQFLKMGCITTAAVGLTVCGAGTIAPAPNQTPVNLPSFAYGEKTMNNRVLIAYASHFGSTANIATTIGDTLATHGFFVDIKPIKDNPQIDGYQAVLLGSAVQYGTWLPEAVDFVKSNHQALNRLPVALFCVHIQNRESTATGRQNRLAYLDEVRPWVQPVAEGFLAGKFDRRGAALIMPGWLARFVPPVDLRNKKRIRAWANSVGPLLLPEKQTLSVR